MTTPALQLKGLVKRFGGLLVTDHVDLQISRGEIHAVIGPNGAGKTTLINQIVGELRSDEGSVQLLGLDVSHWSVAHRARAGLGRSYQINSVIPSFTVLENVLLAVQSAPSSGKHNFHFLKAVTQTQALTEKADALLAKVGLSKERDRLAGVLAYGQQRLIELAMALATEPQVLLLDEPMAGLGGHESEEMIRLLKEIQAQYAILLIEHDMHAVFSLATQVSVLVYGKAILCDTPEAVKTSAVVREAYLGDEEI